MDDLGVALFMETPMLSSCNLTDFNDDIDHNALTISRLPKMGETPKSFDHFSIGSHSSGDVYG